MQTYNFYIAWLYVGVAVLVLSICIAGWISWCYTNNNFPYMW